MSVKAKWETIYEKRIGNNIDKLARVEVPGGWLYESTIFLQKIPTRALVFVPTPVEGADAAHHVCDHGYAARTCGHCERDGLLGGAR